MPHKNINNRDEEVKERITLFYSHPLTLRIVYRSLLHLLSHYSQNEGIRYRKQQFHEWKRRRTFALEIKQWNKVRFQFQETRRGDVARLWRGVCHRFLFERDLCGFFCDETRGRVGRCQSWCVIEVLLVLLFFTERFEPRFGGSKSPIFSFLFNASESAQKEKKRKTIIEGCPLCLCGALYAFVGSIFVLLTSHLSSFHHHRFLHFWRFDVTPFLLFRVFGALL